MGRCNCAVLVTSCDSYSDVWNPFFTLFHIMWPDCPFPVYLNTESKDYSHESIDIQCLHPQKTSTNIETTLSWSNRLSKALRQIKSDYVLFFLEDFFLMSPVRGEKVNECVQILEENPQIGAIRFYDDAHNSELLFGEFSMADPKFDFAINTMVTLWRKEFLLSILRDESPWEFEYCATERWRRTEIEILVHRSEFPLVFDYKVHPDFGYGIFQGKWLKKNIELFGLYGIKVDFDKRGFWENLPDLHAREREKHWLWHDIVKGIKSPKMMGHYIKCTYNVTKNKMVRLKRKYFNT